MGIVVSVKLNNRFKIVLFTLAAVLLVGLGVFIGVSAAKGKADNPAPAAAIEEDGTPVWQRGQEK